MSLSDALHQFLTGQSPADRARHEELRKNLKAKFTKDIKDLEKQLADHDYWQKPENNAFPQYVDRGPEVDRYRADLVRHLEHAREELDFLNR